MSVALRFRAEERKVLEFIEEVEDGSRAVKLQEMKLVPEGSGFEFKGTLSFLRAAD